MTDVFYDRRFWSQQYLRQRWSSANALRISGVCCSRAFRCR